MICRLGKTGILYLTGHRSTVGSMDTLCPPLSTLLSSFQQLHNPKSTLTVGGRALAKHCHRSKDNFWPQSKRNNEKKNEMAFHTVLQIIRNAAWVNVHVVPEGHGKHLPIVEIRHSRGYGARWTADGGSFRGFLEPVSPFYEADTT